MKKGVQPSTTILFEGENRYLNLGISYKLCYLFYYVILIEISTLRVIYRIKEVCNDRKTYFSIPISLQPDSVNLCSLILFVFDLTYFIVWNIKGLQHQVTAILVIRKLGFMIIAHLFCIILCTRIFKGLRHFVVRQKSSKSFQHKKNIYSMNNSKWRWWLSLKS